jgi:hypothetical protein
VAGNTDGLGFLVGLRKASHELSGRRVLLAGAGGGSLAMSPPHTRPWPWPPGRPIRPERTRLLREAASLSQRWRNEDRLM